MVKKLVSVCIPAYNESDCIEELCERLKAVFDGLSDRYECEAIVCENGSHDDTYEKLLRCHRDDPRVKIVRLSRNFYAEGGVTAALAHARGDCAVIMNADLQDPPEYIPAFLEKWEEGYENVYAIVAKRTGESRARRVLAHGYYWAMSRLSESPAPPHVSDFRLIDRMAYEIYLRMPERLKVMRYVWPWIGFRSIGIATERPVRGGGRSKFRFFQTLHGAFLHILVQSRAALTIIPIFGVGLALLSFTSLAAAVVRACFFGVPFDGFGTIVSLMLGLFGLLFLFLWIIGEYVGMIFQEVRQRPTFIVSRTHGLDGREAVGGGFSVAPPSDLRVDRLFTYSR